MPFVPSVSANSVDYERSVLFPAAGLDPARAAEYYEVHSLVDQLSYAGNEAARRYLNGEIDQTAAGRRTTAQAVEEFGSLLSSPRLPSGLR